MIAAKRLNVRQAADKSLTNAQIACLLEEIADRLEAQHANEFRVRAYRSAGQILRHLNREAIQILETEGTEGLRKLHGIGFSLSRTIEQLAFTGESPLLSRLRGDVNAEKLFETVVGIGPRLAHRIHEQLEIESLADLEVSAHDGRLATVEGMGRQRVRLVRETLAGRFRSSPQVRFQAHANLEQPSVEELLDIDEEYRRKAKQDRLTRIAPRRFNPTNTAWLPILHTHRDDRHYTALFSNTARAHKLEMTNDWIVIYRDDQDGAGRWTVVTARFGPLCGKRIVRGREEECRMAYSQ